MQSVLERARAVRSMRSHVQSEAESLDIVLSGLQAQIDSKAKELTACEQAWETLRNVLRVYSDESIRMLQDMINHGVRSIFSDRDYSVEIEVTENKNRSVRLYLIEEINGRKIRSRIPRGMGGGIEVVIAFIFQVYLIRTYNLRPFMVMDESFTQISSQYLDEFIAFMRYLTDLGFTFLWISHDQRVWPYMDRIYNVSMGKITEKKEE